MDDLGRALRALNQKTGLDLRVQPAMESDRYLLLDCAGDPLTTYLSAVEMCRALGEMARCARPSVFARED